MPYCHKCGAELDENARFCRNCGAPIIDASVDAAPETVKVSIQNRRRQPFILLVAILIGILLVAFFFAVVTSVPFMPVNSMYSRTASQADLATVNFNLQADVADVNVIIKDLPDQQVVMTVIAKSSVGLFGPSSQPIKVTFSNETVGQAMTVTSKISRQDAWPLSLDLRVTCSIYLDPAAVLNLTVRTNVGEVTLGDFDVPVIIERLNLRSSTGNVSFPDEPSYLKGQRLCYNNHWSISSTLRNVKAEGNRTINLASTTGSVNAYITQNSDLSRDIFLDAKTTTGSIHITARYNTTSASNQDQTYNFA